MHRFLKRALVVAVASCPLFLSCTARIAGKTSQVPPANFFVATNGNDRWSGRLPWPNRALTDGPFATVARARDSIRSLRDAGALKKVAVVLIRGGVYWLDEPLAFGPEDSGSEKYSITYAAFPGEKPILSGGRLISGWKRGEGNLWMTEVAEVKAGQRPFRQLFVGGQRRPRARSPQEGFFRIVEATKEDRTQFIFREGDLRPWNNLSDVEAVLFHDWAISRMTVAKVDEEEHVVHFPHPVGYQGLPFTAFNQFDPHQRYYVENALEILDSPGEWYLDRNAGILTYWPMPDEDMRRVEVVAPRLQQLLIVKGDLEQPIRNLHFRGLTFCHTDWPLPPEGYGGIQACFFGSKSRERSRIPAAVEFQAAIGCEFEDNRVERLGTTAVNFELGCRSNRIVGNEIADVGANGIMVGEPRNKPVVPAAVSRDNLIANNYIHHCGTDYFGAVGIWIGHTERSVVSHNEVCYLPYTGISVGWTWNPTPTPCRGNVIEFNHIHHILQMMADGGGIYTLGFQPGTVIRGNLIHDVEKTHGRAGSNGMFIDEGSKDFLFEGNVIYNAPDGPIRFNDSQKDWHTFSNNWFSVAPDSPDFPQEVAERAGLEPPYRDALLKKP